ncbi:MAG: hypothetical protein RIS76_1412, partial [Verrucomicrobiota bacterium]
RYEHYLRPVVTSSAEASRTPVQLPTGGTPAIQYQDPVTGALGANLDGQGSFYTYLNAELPVHRTLLRVQKDSAVAFVRVLSWLDQNLGGLRTDYQETLAGQLDGIREFYGSSTAGLTLQGINDGPNDFTRIASSADGQKLVAVTSCQALPNNGGTSRGYIYTSANGGATWGRLSNSDGTPFGQRNWTQVAMSADGNTVAIVETTFGFVFYSTNVFSASVPTWPQSTPAGYRCKDVAVRADGTRIIAASDAGLLRLVADANGVLGNNWITTSGNYTAVAASADFTRIVAVNSANRINLSVNSGANYTLNAVVPSSDGGAPVLAMSADGQSIWYSNGNKVYRTSDFGVSWLTNTLRAGVTDMDMAADGRTVWLAYGDNQVQRITVSDFTAITKTFSESNESFPLSVNGIAVVSGSPTRVFAATPNSKLIRFDFSDTPFAGLPTTSRPLVLSAAVKVGDRINPPAGEGNLAGYIPYPEGQSFDPEAYRNPLVSGFEAARQGAILTVNAIPGKSPLEVWWFREGKTNGVLHPVNGIGAVYWPAVIGRYTPAYPAAGTTDEIVLASNAGSGGLDSLQAKGAIYYRNTPGETGYNPNEEHALMLGGQAYALRDDLNVTVSGPDYSSEAMVLLKYVAADGRPALRPFRVRREKPEAGIVFDYVVEAGGNADRGGAGKPLQPPMPLPLLPPPVDADGNNLNTENSATAGDTPPGWNSDPEPVAGYDSFWATYPRFTFRDRKENFWVKRGVHGGQPVLKAGTYNPATKLYGSTLPTATAIIGQPFTNTFHVSRMEDSLKLSLVGANPLPVGLSVVGLSLQGTPAPGQAASTRVLTFVLTDEGDPGMAVTNTLTLQLQASGTPVAQGPLVMTYGSTTLVGRPPYVAEAPVATNSFSMRFYYLTQEGFAWPGRTAPAVGSIVPYLTQAIGADPTSAATAALPVVYRPVWPGNPPSIRFGDTLTSPKENLPAIRGQTSVELLYQQSQALAFQSGGPKPTNSSVILHDPTRRKTFDLEQGGLAKLPGSVKAQSYLGKVYFPDLPPHLAKRVFFDASLSPLGSLVLKGEYLEPGLGRPFLQLNVLRGNDLLAVQNLCNADDEQKTKWDAAIAGLAAPVPYYVPDNAAPGGYRLEEETEVRSVAVGDLVEVESALEPVDSYALSATGPGSGYVTLVVGNGSTAQTPSGEPVTVYVIKTANELYPGEVKVIASENPLSELSTFQHSPDLAGKFDEYDYQWQIAPPVDGLEPDEGSANWTDLGGPVAPDRALYVLGGAGVQALSDNWIRVRYRPNNPAHPLYVGKVGGAWPATGWSAWTSEIAEGWIKRVLAGINPFNQRVTDLFNNQVNTDASILTSAGKRWEGDVALNLANINNYGLIEIYETVLNR